MGIHRIGAVACAVLLAALAPAYSAPKAAPDFELGLFSGKSFRLAETRGSAVILLFWAPW